MRQIKSVYWVGIALFILMVFIGESISLAAPPALLDAARKGDLKQVEKLLDAGADVNQLDNTGFTALHWAAMTNRQEVAKLLIRHKADINAREFQYELTPLDVAKSRKSSGMVDFLIKNGAK